MCNRKNVCSKTCLPSTPLIVSCVSMSVCISHSFELFYIIHSVELCIQDIHIFCYKYLDCFQFFSWKLLMCVCYYFKVNPEKLNYHFIVCAYFYINRLSSKKSCTNLYSHQQRIKYWFPFDFLSIGFYHYFKFFASLMAC